MPRPRPEITEENAHYWASARQGRLELQRCSDCGYIRAPARWICPECLSESFSWEQMSGRGRIETFVWYLQSFDERCLEIPYSVAVVELEEGPKLLTNVTDVEFGELEVGQAVTAWFENLDDECAVVLFRPQEG